MLSPKIREAAIELIKQMVASGQDEAPLPNSPLIIVKEGKDQECDLPIAQINGYLIVQRLS